MKMKHMKTKKASRTILACLLACLLTGTALLSGCSKDSAGAVSGNTSAESQSNTTESGTESGQTVSGTGDSASSGAADTSQSDTTDSSSKTQGGINTKPVESSNSTKPFTKPKYDLKGRELIVWGVTQPKKGTIEYESWKEVEAEYSIIFSAYCYHLFFQLIRRSVFEYDWKAEKRGFRNETVFDFLSSFMSAVCYIRLRKICSVC